MKQWKILQRRTTQLPVLNPPTDRTYERKTVLVIGQGKGGTSVVCSVLDALGVYVGSDEDIASGGAFENHTLNKLMYEDPDAAEKEITRLCGVHSVWGHKLHHPAMPEQRMIDAMHSVYLVFVFRDILAPALRYAEDDVNRFPDVVSALKHSRELSDLIYDLVTTTTYPSLLVSYDNIKSSPEIFVKCLSGFLRLTPTGEQWAESVGRVQRSGGYLVIEEPGIWPVDD